MDKEVSIQSIKIMMGKREVELSIEEAKKLKKALEEIFGVKVVETRENHHYHDYYRYYGWNKFYCSEPAKYDFGQVYCSADKKTTINGFTTNSTLCLDIK